MKKLIAFTLVAVMAFIGFTTLTTQAAGTTQFGYQVVDADTGAPVANATVVVTPVNGFTSAAVTTDANGYAIGSVPTDPQGWYHVSISHPDYKDLDENTPDAVRRFIVQSSAAN